MTIPPLERQADIVTQSSVQPVPHDLQSHDPPLWALLGLAVAYIVALATLAFFPGATLIERLRALDGGICAQLPSHSFFLAGQQLPLCSRNTGIYLSFISTILVLGVVGRVRASRFPSKWVALALAAAILLMAVDGFNSLFLDLGLPHLYQPHNLLRLLTGLGTGTAMAAFVVPVANSLVWRDEDARATFKSFGQLTIMVPVLLLVFLAVGSQAAVFLYPVALLSSFGVLMALSLINLIFMLGMSNRVGRFRTWRQVLPFFSFALALAVLELIGLFALKMTFMHGMSSRYM